MNIWIDAMRDFENLNLRIELRYSDDSPVGTFPQIPLGAFCSGQRREFLVDADPIGLTEGTYRVDMVLFEKNEYGTSFDKDLLLPAFYLKVQEHPDIVWNMTSWGHICFNNVSAVPCDEEH